MSIILIMVIISQCIHISKHQVIHYKYTQFIYQLYLTKAEGKKFTKFHPDCKMR